MIIIIFNIIQLIITLYFTFILYVGIRYFNIFLFIIWLFCTNYLMVTSPHYNYHLFIFNVIQLIITLYLTLICRWYPHKLNHFLHCSTSVFCFVLFKVLFLWCIHPRSPTFKLIYHMYNTCLSTWNQHVANSIFSLSRSSIVIYLPA